MLAGRFGRRVAVLYGVLLLLNLGSWGWLYALRSHSHLAPMGVLAFVFGLRHALDADHLAAIDNTTRKLMQGGRRPTGVGFFFSLGHSAVVAMMTVAVAFGSRGAEARLPWLRQIGGLLGTTVSAGFMYLIGLVNVVILVGIYGVFREARSVARSGSPDWERVEALLLKRGLMSRVVGPVYRAIEHSRQMFAVGLLFGLGFDTASEVAVLGMASLAAGQVASPTDILVLPALFAAGMGLADTTDGILMLHAYGWAFRSPVRKVFYNLTVTAMSILVALLIGTIEGLQVVSRELSLAGPFWQVVQGVDFAGMGYIVVAVLVGTWLAASVPYRLKGYDRRAAIGE